MKEQQNLEKSKTENRTKQLFRGRRTVRDRVPPTQVSATLPLLQVAEEESAFLTLFDDCYRLFL
jgi:hypothetical protein